MRTAVPDPAFLRAVPAGAAPRTGTFYSLQRPSYPPLPFDPFPDLPLYTAGDGCFVVDDSAVAYPTPDPEALAAAVTRSLAAQATEALNALLGLDPGASLGTGGNRMMASSLASSYAYGNPVYLTDLTTAVASNGTSASFSIAGGTNNVPYDILMTTNLAAPLTDWAWLGLGYTSNRYTFSNQPPDHALFALAKPQKTMVVGWGTNSAGQCDVPSGVTNAVAVTGGWQFSLALLNNGTVIGWGFTNAGGLVPANLAGVAMIASGWQHNVALLTNGQVTAWGADMFGVLNVPSNLTNATVISAQALNTLALRTDGTVVGWGDDSCGQTNVPVGLGGVTAIAAGGQHSLAVSNGFVVAWGRDDLGQCRAPSGLSNVIDVAAGPYHSLALLKNGTVVAWGGNSHGETNVPVGLSNVVAIAAGDDPYNRSACSVALKSDGTVVAWGDGEVVSPLGGLTDVIAIGAGADHALALRTGPATPVITLQPTDQYTFLGGDVTFTARGAGLYGVTYQWQTNGVNLPGATNATLTLTNVSAAQTGVVCRVLVANELGSLLSSNASPKFVTPPVIDSLTQPANQVAIYPGNLMLQVHASAPGQNSGFPLAYEWQFNGTPIASAHAAAYTIHTTTSYPGTYSVRVSNAAGSTNASWQVTVYNPGGLLITQHPTNQYQIAGGSVTFLGGAVGSNSVAYQWAFNGTDLAGATNAALTLTNVQAAQQGDYHFVASSAGSSLTSSNAALTLVTPPGITYQSPPTNIVCIYGNHVGLAATADAPGQANGFPLAYRWQVNGTNLTGATGNALDFFATDASPGVYTLTVSNAAGATNVSWRVTLTNAINVTNDLLLIYNTNSADSISVKDYYLAHRPNVAGANVLAVGYTNAAAPGYYETITPADLTNQLFAPVNAWLSANPTKRPQYVILFLDLPSRVNDSAGTNVFYPTTGIHPSVSVQLRSLAADWQPFVTHLNMGMTNTVNRTNDCIGYINKLATNGTPIASNSPVLSASAGGYANTNYVVDDVHYAGYQQATNAYVGSLVVSSATNGLLAAGVATNAITFLTGIEDSTPQTHVTSATHVAGYISWGFHSSLNTTYAVSNGVSWQGNSGWYLIQTIESHNGQQHGDCGNFIQWYSSYAFGGINYSNTPVGAVSYVDEPTLLGNNTSSVYFGLWASGKNFGICAWNSRVVLLDYQSVFQAVGDPLTVK